jgi:hypothetical protein
MLRAGAVKGGDLDRSSKQRGTMRIKTVPKIRVATSCPLIHLYPVSWRSQGIVRRIGRPTSGSLRRIFSLWLRNFDRRKRLGHLRAFGRRCIVGNWLLRSRHHDDLPYARRVKRRVGKPIRCVPRLIDSSSAIWRTADLVQPLGQLRHERKGRYIAIRTHSSHLLFRPVVQFRVGQVRKEVSTIRCGVLDVAVERQGSRDG